LEKRLDMFETFDVTHRREPLRCELTHMAKIYDMLSQIAEGGTRNLAALLGCFVGTKSDGEVLEYDAATPRKHQVQYVTKMGAEPVCHIQW
jgi:hypothetical protein